MKKVPLINENKEKSLLPLSHFLKKPIDEFTSQIFQFKVSFAVDIPERELYMNETDLEKLSVKPFSIIQAIPRKRPNDCEIFHVFVENTITEGYILISANYYQELGIQKDEIVNVKPLNDLFLKYSASVFDLKLEIQKLILLYLIDDYRRNNNLITRLHIFDYLNDSVICNEDCLTQELLGRHYFDMVFDKLKSHSFVTIMDGTLKIMNAHPDLKDNIKTELSQVLNCLKGW